MTHGLVIGKFYPPHAGHHLLIRAAASACSKVSVIVMAAARESIPLDARVRWLREEHADAPHVAVTGIEDELPMDLADAAVWEGHVEIMRTALGRLGAPRVTAVFTSESYGAELARRFDAVPVPVDIERKLAPVSSTQVRSDPQSYWQHLSAPVRGGLAARVVVLGAESSGTTTLSLALAHHWRARGGGHAFTAWVPEYGRAYTAQKWANARVAAAVEGRAAPALERLSWTSAEFVHIAARQNAAEETAARSGGPLLICDTDAFATTIWHERYVGHPSDEVARLADVVRHALYLVTDHREVPFEQDGLRDGEARRAWMTERFVASLEETSRPHLLIRGSHQQRLEQAVLATTQLLGKAWRFGPV